jgi:ribosome-binding factor A
MRDRKTESEPKSKRPLRIAAEIKRDLPDLIRRFVTIPGSVLVSITGVEVSSDLSHATVFISTYGGSDRDKLDITHLLNAKKSQLRSQLAQQLIMRQHPDLKFVYDETPARAARIEALLKQIHDSANPDDAKD